MTLPAKMFFRIGEVAGLVGVEPHVLRFWEREFRSIRPTKSAKGQRVYSRKDVENLLRVRDLLYRDGFTIAGAKKKLQPSGNASGIAPKATAEHADAVPARRRSAAKESRAAKEPLDATPALVALAEPAPSAGTRAKLLALRGEVEAFLTELSSNDD